MCEYDQRKILSTTHGGHKTQKTVKYCPFNMLKIKNTLENQPNLGE